jgi:regulator of protease activity HflC (stomatin/prohibitin superfamily)
MENNNEYSHLTLEELWDLQSAKEKELEEQLAAPVNYYIPGDSMTYLSAMSQQWGIEATRVEIRRLQDEIDKRIRPAKRE